MILEAVSSHYALNDIQSCRPLTSGLINSSYKVKLNNGDSYFLQKVNTAVFKSPLALQHNYLLVQNHLSCKGGMELPKLIKTASGDLLFEKNNEVWRCFQFLENTYSPEVVETPEKAYEVANCFGSFTAALQSFDKRQLTVILPNFHDLELRFQQFEQAMRQAPV